MDAADAMTRRPAARRHGRVVRWLGTGLIVAGLAVLVWSFVVWRWNDPFTGLYTRWQQQRLDHELAALVQQEPPLAVRRQTPRRNVMALIAQRASEFRAHAPHGGPIGRIRVPRLGLDMVLVNGTDASTLKKGPGRDRRTFMPGQHNLVYVAGHRTTYGAPFARIDDMRGGDTVTIQMPYATFRYRVTTHQIVDAHDLSVLRPRTRELLALQACHPRFFATQRYIVWARLLQAVPRTAAG